MSSKSASTVHNALAINLRRLRKQHFPGRGGSKRCAKAMGVSPQQWSPWETGSRIPNQRRIKQIAEIFGVAVSELLNTPAQSTYAQSKRSNTTKSIKPVKSPKTVVAHPNFDENAYIIIHQGIKTFATLLVKEVFTQLNGQLDSIDSIHE